MKFNMKVVREVILTFLFLLLVLVVGMITDSIFTRLGIYDWLAFWANRLFGIG